MQRCDVLGTSLGFGVEGSEHGPAVLLIHGVPGSARDFRYLAPLLAQTCRVYRLDMPGFGTVHDADWSDQGPVGRSRLISAFADVSRLSRFIVVGHSIGFGVALATAVEDAERASGLVAIAGIGLRRHRGMTVAPWVANAIGIAARIPGVGALFARGMRGAYRRHRFPGADTLRARDVIIQSGTVGSFDFKWAARAAGQVRCPTLVAWAVDDPLIEAEISEELAASIDGAAALRYDSGGHNLAKTQAVHLAGRILAMVEA
jgi:pimeloyl-ACP methyl ester carboxylesterase